MWKKCTPLWREAHFQVKMDKAHHSRGDVEKVDAVVARSTLSSQNVQSTPFSDHLFLEVEMSKKRTPLWPQAHFQVKGSDHFWKLTWRKSVRRCGMNHISKSRVSKTDGLGALLEVVMSKKCAPLWREAHFQVKSVKNCGFEAFFDVQLSKKCTLTNLTNLTNLNNLTN